MYKKSFDLTKKRHIQKFDELIRKNKITQSPTNITDKKKWVINMSSKKLTRIETGLLAKSLNFSITSKNSKPPKDNLSKVERKASKEIQSDRSIVILWADKGRSTVVINSENYLEKCMDHISNGPYQLLKKKKKKILLPKLKPRLWNN